MALKRDCERYLSERVLVEPQYGYGWNSQKITQGGSYSDVPIPPPFRMLIQRFFEMEGQLAGGVGRISEEGHALDGLLVGFAGRHKEERDFVEHPVTCTLTVGSSILETRNGSLLAVGAPALVGFGILRDARASLRDGGGVTNWSDYASLVDHR